LETLGKFRFEIDLTHLAVRTQIPGEPQAWERAGRSGAASYDTAKNKAGKKTIRDYLWMSNPKLTVDFTSRFGVIFLFATNLWKTDADNYAKLALDAVKGFVWNDDRQVDEIYTRTIRGVNLQPRSELTFYKIIGGNFK
jgi:Holliday junction resolvase RusA-like endonuclease